MPLLAPTGTLTNSNCDYTTQPVSNVDLGTVKGCTPDKTSTPVTTTTNIGTTTKMSTPAGATIVTETISDKSMVVTYAVSSLPHVTAAVI